MSKPRSIDQKICPMCGLTFGKPTGWSSSAWAAVTCCSQQCRSASMRGRINKPLADRISEKITYEPTSGCWLWTGGLSSYGYAAMQINKMQRLVHKIMFERCNGEVPDGGILCHTCNVRSCVNPNHLYVGTPASNYHDAVAANRHPHGDTHGHAKLSEVDVRDMRRLYADGMSLTAIALTFGVTRPTATKACKGASWQHVK